VKLYYAETLNPRKACAVARHLDAPVDYVAVDLASGENRSPGFLALNPNGKVPVLQEGGRSLWEADAIMCRLSDAMGADLWPHDGRQVEVMRWLSFDARHFGRHAATLWFERLIKPLIGLGGPDEAAVEEADLSFRKFAKVLDAHLATRLYVVGDALSIADFALAAPLPYADAAAIPLAPFPAIRRWHDRLNRLAAWRDPFPARGMMLLDSTVP
jgi:glutathione S-transferase